MTTDHDRFDWKTFLGQHPLFGTLEAKDVDTLIDPNNSKQREFDREAIIFRAGEIGNSFFLIGEGSVNVELSAEDSNSTIISTLYKGDYFGEMSAIDSQHGRAATILANEDCKLLEIKSKPFQKILKANPELEFELLSMLAARLRRVNDHLLKNTRLTYDTKFSLLAEKIESQSKVVDASLNASQAVFEQTKVRTTEIINAAERGRTRITWVMSTLTAGFTLLLAFFGFLGYEKLDSAKALVEEIKGVRESVVTVQQEIEDAKQFVENSKQTVIEAKREVEELNTMVSDFKTDIEDSKNAKRILFETFLPVFRLQIEQQIKTGVQLNPANLGRQILRANDDVVTTRLFRELYFIIEEYHSYIEDNLNELQSTDLDQARREELLADNVNNRAMISFCSHFMFLYLYDPDQSLAKNELARFLANYLLLVTYALDEKYVEDINWNHKEAPDKYPLDDFDLRLSALNEVSSGDEGKKLQELDGDFLYELKNISVVTGKRKNLINQTLK